MASQCIDLEAALARARLLAGAGERRILGIAGTPGAGKSTLARQVVQDLGPAAVYVPMDGFHLANHELRRLRRQDRKGAIDTFDGAGFLNLLWRMRRQGSETVYGPLFMRDIEEPIAGWIPVSPEVPLVVTEGNYLLVDQDPWREVRPLLDEAWYVETDEATRIERLVARHVAFGKSADEARRWALGSDEINARLIRTTRARADVIVCLG
jgi:pantothenate kinase